MLQVKQLVYFCSTANLVAPVIDSVSRINSFSANVNFSVSPSDTMFDHYEVHYHTSTGLNNANRDIAVQIMIVYPFFLYIDDVFLNFF